MSWSYLELYYIEIETVFEQQIYMYLKAIWKFRQVEATEVLKEDLERILNLSYNNVLCSEETYQVWRFHNYLELLIWKQLLEIKAGNQIDLQESLRFLLST